MYFSAKQNAKHDLKKKIWREIWISKFDKIIGVYFMHISPIVIT